MSSLPRQSLFHSPPMAGHRSLSRRLRAFGLLLGAGTALAAGTVPMMALAADAGTSAGEVQLAAGRAPVQLDPVTVLGTRTEKTVSEVPASVTVVGAEEIRQRQPDDLGDLLDDIPGVEMSGGPRRTAMQPVIRGLTGERVVLRVDGARQNFESGHRGRIFIDPSLLERVEVRRGPASSLYGSGAIGGVMEVETINPGTFLEDGEPWGGEVGVSWESNGDGFGGHAIGATRLGDNAEALVGFTGFDADDLENGAGDTIPFTADDVRSGLVKLVLRPAEGHQLTASYMQFRDEHIIPSAANTNTNSIIVDRKTDQKTMTLGWRFDGNGNPWFDLDARIYRTETSLDERRIDTGRFDETDLATTGIDIANTSRFQLGGFGNHALTYGVEAYRDDQDGQRDGGDRDPYPDARQDILGLFVQDEIVFFDRLTFTPGVRFDRFDREANNQNSASDDAVSPSISVAYAVTPWLNAYASYAEAFRAPSLTELYASGEHFPGNNFKPNPDLRPETAKNKEIGLTLSESDVLTSGDRITGRVAAFRNDVEDFIEMQVQFLGYPGTTTRNNVQDARLDGVEFELAYDAPLWFASFGAARIRGDDRTEGDALGGLPGDKVSLGGGLKFMGGDVVTGWRMVAHDKQDRVATGEAVTPGYAVHDAWVSFQPSDGGLRGARFDLGVDNVFDKTYRQALSELDDPGRTVKLTAAYRF
ncbi:TonB-dependent hemoglobin/transferrin/lactoferrin family receptor [Tistrella arctica]|uniref:TonB-dependent hemoglobin/transferrin/lactoferrin family receptor n=2 Tax=Tistrella TaxID=171436 RepID=UPI0031F64999